MNICIVVDNLDTGAGWGRLAANVAQGLRVRGHEVRTITQHGDSGGNSLVVSFRTASLGDLLSLPSRLLRIRSFIAPCDAVLCFDVNPYGIIVCLATLFQGKRIVLDCLGTYSLVVGGAFKRALSKWVFRHVDAVLLVSDFVRRQIARSGVRFGETHVVPVGVDSAFFVDEAMPSPLRHPYILSVGGVKHRKGYHLSLQAFALLAKEFADLRYVIIGDQSMTDYVGGIKRLSRDLHVEDRIVFMEQVSDSVLRAYYRSANVFVLTSVTDSEMIEGFGMVYLEAGACGVPVVGPRNTGAEAAIVDGITGFLVSHEPGDIAAAIRRILTDLSLAGAMGRAGREHAREFDWSHIVDMYERYLAG